MRRTEALQWVRMAVFLNILHRWESAELNQEEAAELLGVSERTFRRWQSRYEEEGEAGLVDRRLGKASGKRVPVDRAEEVEALYRERYQGFTVKHFHEHLVKDHGFGSWLHLVEAASSVEGCGGEGAAQGGAPQEARAAAIAGDDAASGRLAARMARGRAGARPDRDLGRRDGGDLFGAPHRGGRDGLDLPGAEGGVWGARAADEPLHRPRRALLPHAEGGRRDRPRPSHPGRPGAPAIGRRAHRGLFASGARTIGAGVWDAAGSPAKGAEACGDHDDRGGQRLHARELPARLQRPLRRPAAQPGAAFTPIPGVDLDEILCVEEERQVGNDNCVSYRTLKLQIPASPMRAHFVKEIGRAHV